MKNLRSNFQAQRNENGMTLLELLFVILIMGTLLAIVLPSMITGSQDTVSAKAVELEASAVSTKVMENYLDNGGRHQHKGGDYSGYASYGEGIGVDVKTTDFDHCVMTWSENTMHTQESPYIVYNGKPSDTCPIV